MESTEESENNAGHYESPWSETSTPVEPEEKKPTPKKGLRINAKKLFLTYPQCNLTKEELLAKLKAITTITQYVIAEEKHENGDPHLHAVIECARKVNLEGNHRMFDIKGAEKSFHPNIQAVRKWTDATQYVKKDGNFIESYTFDDTNPINYRKRKADYEEYKNDMEKKTMGEVKWPVRVCYTERGTSTPPKVIPPYPPRGVCVFRRELMCVPAYRCSSGKGRRWGKRDTSGYAESRTVGKQHGSKTPSRD